MGSFKLFKMHLRVPFMVLALIEFLICASAVYVAVYVRFNANAFDAAALERYNIHSLLLSAIIFGSVMPMTMMAMGLYQYRFRGGVMGVFLRSVIGFAAGSALLALLYYVFPALYLGRGVFGIAVVIAFFMVGTIRPLFFYYVDKDTLKLRVLVFGAGKRAASINKRLRRKVDRRGFRISGYVVAATDEESDIDDRYRVRPPHSLLQYCVDNNIDEIVVAPDEKRGAIPLSELLECKLNGVAVTDLLAFFEREQGKIPLDIMRPDWLIYSEGFDQSAVRDIAKRIFDVIVSGILVLLTFPLMILAALAIKLEDGWNAPIFYHQVRTGFLGKPFSVYKFRSMTVNAEKEGVAQWATRNDARVTKVGGIMRTTRIDELPQILNVLLGDMSFVGPRPERPHFVEELSQKIPYYQERHAVKPGVTGWAQVSYPYGASLEDSVQKHEYDLFYIKNHTIFLDLLILCQTAEVVFFGKGAR